MKVISFSQQGPRAICILSANGVIANVTLRQQDSLGGTVTYEVCPYCLLKLYTCQQLKLIDEVQFLLANVTSMLLAIILVGHSFILILHLFLEENFCSLFHLKGRELWPSMASRTKSIFFTALYGDCVVCLCLHENGQKKH